MRGRAATFVLMAALVLPVGCGGKGNPEAAPASGMKAGAVKAGSSKAGSVKIDGALGEPRTWGVDGLATLPLQTQDVSFLGEGTMKSVSGKGVLLYDLLQRAKPKFDLKKKRDALRYAVLVQGVDNYDAALSWGEIDPDFANKPILVTVEENGKRLERPGLIVPGDKHGGRHVYDIERITLEPIDR